MDSMGVAGGHPIYGYSSFLKIGVLVFLKLLTVGRIMRVYEASTHISAEFGGIRDLSCHLSLMKCSLGTLHECENLLG